MEPEASQNQTPDHSQNSPAYKSPNLVGYTVLGHGTITEEKIIKSPFTPRNIVIAVFIFSLALILFSLIISALPKKESPNVPPPPVTPPVVVTSPETPSTGATPSTYTNLENRFSITHPNYVTEGGSAPDPFPVALELRYNEPAVEFKIGEEKPGWYIRISKRIAVKSGVTLKDYGLENKLLTTESTTETTLAGVPAITWRSAVFPQTFYLLDTGDGLFFIKTSIKSQNETQYQDSINKILNTIKFLVKPADPDLGLSWTRRSFGDSWNIEVPELWQVNDDGASNGLIIATGSYLGNKYQLTFSYPDFADQTTPGIPDSLTSWVLNDLGKLSADEKALVKTNELKVSQTPAEEVLNYSQSGSGGFTHRLYIWERGGRNPGRVIINQISGELDSQKMQSLFERFIKGIN